MTLRAPSEMTAEGRYFASFLLFPHFLFLFLVIPPFTL